MKRTPKLSRAALLCLILCLSFCRGPSKASAAQSAGPASNSVKQNVPAAATDYSRVKPSKILPSAPKAVKAWPPADLDVDSRVSQVAPDVPCSLSEVVAAAGQRVKELVTNVDRFTATEVVEHQSVDRAGNLGRVQTRKFEYVVAIAEGYQGYLRFTEFRNRGRAGPPQFPDQIATNGTPSLVLIFHPKYVNDFQMTCEGLSQWRGSPAWQVRFEQRPDHPNRISAISMGGHYYNIGLRGRAWILSNNHQIVHIETDLIEEIPKIHLYLEHMNVDYGAITFSSSKQQLWLPSTAELFLSFQGKRFYRRHRFTDFNLFSVDTQYQVANPPEDVTKK
jgi:hypothetical protein